MDLPATADVDTTNGEVSFEAFGATLDELRRASRRAHAESNSELTISQLMLLETLAEADGPLGVCEMASQAGIAAPTATRMLATLRRRGAVSQRRSETDARVTLTSLTEEGQAEVGRKRAAVGRRTRALYDSLTAAERRAAQRILSRFTAVLEDR